MFQRLKRQLLPKGIKRSSVSYANRVFRRVSPKKLEKDFRALGIEADDMVCVHSSLSGIGHIISGSESLITVIKKIIGPRGTLMMPTFTGGGSTYNYVKSNPPPFDRGNTPASTGYLCEVFRKQPGVIRSIHPTHSVAARGPFSKELIAGHENSYTPFGDGTPYDYLIRENGKVLLLNINANSLMHRIQEMVDWPNRYLEESFTIDIFDDEEIRTVKTAVHSPGPYSHMVFPGKGEKEVLFIHLPSYGLPFLLGEKEAAIFQHLQSDVSRFLQARYKWFLDQDIVSKGKVGFGQAVLLKAAPFAARIQKDIADHLSRNPGLYDRDRLKRMWKAGKVIDLMPVL